MSTCDSNDGGGVVGWFDGGWVDISKAQLQAYFVINVRWIKVVK